MKSARESCAGVRDEIKFKIASVARERFSAFPINGSIRVAREGASDLRAAFRHRGRDIRDTRLLSEKQIVLLKLYLPYLRTPFRRRPSLYDSIVYGYLGRDE